MNRNLTILLLVIFYILLTFVDLGLNLLNFVPVVGTLTETLGEVMTEILSAIIFLVVTYKAVKE